MKIGINEIMKGVVWLIAGWALCFHWYQLDGLWGTRNALAHTARTAVAACETNADVAVDNDASVHDLKRCPKVVLPPVRNRPKI